jgi:hypothetical protein
MNRHETMREKIGTWSREARQEMYQYSRDYEAIEKQLKDIRLVILEMETHGIYFDYWLSEIRKLTKVEEK